MFYSKHYKYSNTLKYKIKIKKTKEEKKRMEKSWLSPRSDQVELMVEPWREFQPISHDDV